MPLGDAAGAERVDVGSDGFSCWVAGSVSAGARAISVAGRSWPAVRAPGRLGLIVMVVLAMVAVGPGPAGASRVQEARRGLSAVVRPSPGHLIVGRAISLPPALFKAGPVGSASLISPSQADDVERAMWKLWESALVRSDTRALSQLVAPGPMLEGKINECALPDGHCVFETAPRPIMSLQTIVPLQQGYPLYFLAEIRTTEYVNAANGLVAQEPWIELQILTKASAQASWMLSFDTGYNDANGGTPSLLPFDLAAAGPSAPAGGQEAYNVTVQRAPPVPANRFLTLLAAYWQSYKDTGHAPAQSAFISDGYTSGVGKQLARNRQGSVYAGHRDTFRFAHDAAAGTWEFSAGGGYPLLCGAVRDLATFTPLKGFLYQNLDESNYGVPLPSGYYRRITTTAEHETCVYVAQGGLDAVGNTIYTSRVTGAFAKRAPGQANSVLSDLETDYSVLAHQLAQYEKRLARCVRRHATQSCSKPFAVQAEHEFAIFERRLGTDTFPARVRGQVNKLAATARKLTKLFEQLTTSTPTVETLAKIAAGAVTLNRQYTTLVHELS